MLCMIHLHQKMSYLRMNSCMNDGPEHDVDELKRTNTCVETEPEPEPEPEPERSCSAAPGRSYSAAPGRSYSAAPDAKPEPEPEFAVPARLNSSAGPKPKRTQSAGAEHDNVLKRTKSAAPEHNDDDDDDDDDNKLTESVMFAVPAPVETGRLTSCPARSYSGRMNSVAPDVKPEPEPEFAVPAPVQMGRLNSCSGHLPSST
jgi:hypothetical protein